MNTGGAENGGKVRKPMRRTVPAPKTANLVPIETAVEVELPYRNNIPPRYWRSFETGIIRGGMIWNPPVGCPSAKFKMMEYWVDTGSCNMCKKKCICKTKELSGRDCKDPALLPYKCGDDKK